MATTGNSQFDKMLKAFGPNATVAYVRWTPTAYSSANDQTLTESAGVASVRQTAAGAFTINFCMVPKAIVPIHVGFVENDTTLYHFVRCDSTSASAATATVTHKSVAFASVASGPTLSDTVDELCFAFILRTEN
jgi:hypothetical protein